MVWTGPYRSKDQWLSEIALKDGKTSFFEWRYNEVNGSTQMDTPEEEFSLQYRLVDQKKEILQPWTNAGMTSVLSPEIVEEAREQLSKRPFFFDGTTMLSHVIPLRKPVDLSSIGKTRVLLFGEHHDSDSTKVFLVQLLPELKALGYTHMGMEMVPENLQRDLDFFFKSGDIRKLSKVKTFLDEKWKYGDDGTGRRYFDLIVEAQKLGIRTIALDVREADYETIKTETNLQEIREKQMDKMMREVIRSNDGSRLFALMGNYHACSERIRSALGPDNHRVASFTTGFVGANELLSKMAQEANVHREAFMVEAAGYRFPRGRAPFDIQIHLPQTEVDASYAFLQQLQKGFDALGADTYDTPIVILPTILK